MAQEQVSRLAPNQEAPPRPSNGRHQTIFEKNARSRVSPAICVPAWPQFMRGCVRYRPSLDQQMSVPQAWQDMPSDTPKRKFAGSELVPGKTYRVTTAFEDYDGLPHAVGETWRFVSHSFLPYEDGLTLFVERNGRTAPFRLQWRTETQGHIISEFSTFVEEL
jgi:hypothetical protein